MDETLSTSAFQPSFPSGKPWQQDHRRLRSCSRGLCTPRKLKAVSKVAGVAPVASARDRGRTRDDDSAAYTLHLRYHELVTCGEADTSVDIDKRSARLHADLTRSEFHRIQGDGHMIHHLVPYEVMNAIDNVAKPA